MLFQRPFEFLLRISNEALVTGRVDKDTRAFLRIAPKLSQQIEVAPVRAKKHIARQAVQQSKRMPKILGDAGIACRPIWAGDKMVLRPKARPSHDDDIPHPSGSPGR